MNDPLREILDTYLRVPDTPTRASPADVQLARAALLEGVEAQRLAHAIRLATLRRHLRNPEAPPLHPVRSIAYYLRTLEGLDSQAFEPGYVDYVLSRFDQITAPAPREAIQESRPQDQNTALLLDR